MRLPIALATLVLATAPALPVSAAMPAPIEASLRGAAVSPVETVEYRKSTTRQRRQAAAPRRAPRAYVNPGYGGYNSWGYVPYGAYNSGTYNSGAYNSWGFNPGAYNSGAYNSGAYNSWGYNPGAYTPWGHCDPRGPDRGDSSAYPDWDIC